MLTLMLTALEIFVSVPTNRETRDNYFFLKRRRGDLVWSKEIRNLTSRLNTLERKCIQIPTLKYGKYIRI